VPPIIVSCNVNKLFTNCCYLFLSLSVYCHCAWCIDRYTG